MATTEVTRIGFLNGERVPRPKKSPKDFEWPAPRLADEATKLKFQTVFTEQLRERGMDHIDFARLSHGEHKGPNGHVVPRNSGQARKWAMGEQFPSEEAAAGIAGYFKISLAKLLEPKGALVPIELRREVSSSKKRANGHDKSAVAAAAKKGNGAHRVHEEPPPPVPLPEGATPPTVELKTFPGDQRFMAVVISGVLPVDRALALVAMIHPEHR